MIADAQAARVAAALDYAARGWHVFPLLPGSKRPACPGHPAARCDRSDPYCRRGHAGWETRATTSEPRIVRAWSSQPYGIGIACGPSELLVIDTDRPKPGFTAESAEQAQGLDSGDQVLNDLAAAHGLRLPDTYTVSTPSGGRHRYYRSPSRRRLGNSAGRLGWLVDTRGHGGYVVAPPTELDPGRRYVTDVALPLAWLPDWLTAALTTPHGGPTTTRRPAPPQRGKFTERDYGAAAVTAETSLVRAAQPGQRNHALFCAAVALGQLVAGGVLDEHATRRHLYEACTGHIVAGAFTAGEADATITSGLHRGRLTPRTGPRGRSAA